jgi:hypothetical protein
VLIIGMAYVTTQYAADAQLNVAAGTTNAPARDRARILALLNAPSRSHWNIITLNKDIDAVHCEPKQHVQGSIGWRLAKELKDTYGEPFFFRHIFLDYFRFPTEYMREAYSVFVKEMLPKLIQLGLFTDDSELVAPNLQGLLQPLVGVKFQGPAAAAGGARGAASSCYLRFDPLAAADYPLYASTNSIGADVLGNYINQEQIAQLNKLAPFASSIASQQPAAAASKAFVVESL